jgi:heme exporter protein C
VGLIALCISGVSICTAIAADDLGYWPVGLVFGVICLAMGLRDRVPVGPAGTPSRGLSVLGLLLLVLVPVHLWLIFGFAPQEATMGLAQKIFYFHVPSAYGMYVGFGVALVGSIGYLLNRPAGRLELRLLFVRLGSIKIPERPTFDALAVAGAEVGLLFCLIVLITGPLWARKAWGVYWSWDPQLTVTLLAGLIFTGAVVLRSFGGGEAEKRFASGLAVVGTFLIPIIHYSVQRWRGQHPTVVRSGGGGLHPDMRVAFFFGLFTFTLLVAYLITARFKLERDRHALAELESDAAEAGLLEDA